MVVDAARFLEEDAWGEELPQEQALERARNLASEETGLLFGLAASYKMVDLPKLYQYGVSVTPARLISDASSALNLVDDNEGTGTSFLPPRAMIKAVGEGLERYAVGIYRERDLLWGSRSALERQGHVCLDPNEIAGVVRDDSAPSLNESAMQWVAAYSVRTHERMLVPAHLVFVPYRFHADEPVIQPPISTGCASGTSYGAALLRAILELVERESFMLAYLHQHHPREFDLSQIDHPLIERAITSLDYCRLELLILDITSDLGIPVALGIVVDRTGRYPAVNLGAKAGLSVRAAVVGAIEEAFQTMAWGRALLAKLPAEIDRIKTAPLAINSHEERMFFGAKAEMLRALEFFLSPTGRSPISTDRCQGGSVRDSLKKTFATLRAHGIDVYAKDLTTPDVRAHGFVVVKAMSPQLVPLYLEEEHRCWRAPRLFNVPRSLAWPEAKGDVLDLNQVPHPFL